MILAVPARRLVEIARVVILLTCCGTAGPDVVLVHPESGVQRRCMIINTQVSRTNPWYGLAAIPAGAIGQGRALGMLSGPSG